MVTTLQDEDRPEPWLKKRKPVAPTTRETRTSAKANVGKEKDVVESVPSYLPSESGRGRGRKGKSKVVDNDKGPKKRQCVPSATADVVLGRAQNTVPSVEELRRKTDEDARACGRITRTVRYPVPSAANAGPSVFAAPEGM